MALAATAVLLPLAPTASAAAAKPPAVQVRSGFGGAAAERWRFIRFDLRNHESVERRARLELRFASGRSWQGAVDVPSVGHAVVTRYVYEGGTDSLIGASARMAGAEAEWMRADSIPADLPVVVVTADDARYLPLEGVLSSREGVGVIRAAPDGLPDRALGWVGVVAVAGHIDEMPAAGSPEASAVTDWLHLGGTLLLYGEARGEGPLSGAVDGPLGQGRVVRMGRGRSLPPPLAARRPPLEAPALTSVPLKPPVAWLGRRALWYLPAALLALLLVAGRPRRGLAALALIGLAVAASPPTNPGPADQRLAEWRSEGDTVRWELALVPARSGLVDVPLPAGADATVVALDAGEALDLRATESGGFQVRGRWGEPIRLLVESIARAD